MMRFLVFLAVILAIFFYFKKLFPGRKKYRGRDRHEGPRPPRKLPPIVDELVQDPVCGVYCPRREAKTLVCKGRKYYFCSMECLRKFQSENC